MPGIAIDCGPFGVTEADECRACKRAATFNSKYCEECQDRMCYSCGELPADDGLCACWCRAHGDPVETDHEGTCPVCEVAEKAKANLVLIATQDALASIGALLAVIRPLPLYHQEIEEAGLSLRSLEEITVLLSQIERTAYEVTK
jgi:hypothetical protein